MANFILNDDAAHVERIRVGIEKKKQKFGKGYCPCVLPKLHSDDTVCPCLEYRTKGICHCGLYKNETEE